MSSRALNYEDYAVGWICALSKELIAAMAMLDESYPTLPRDSNDINSYQLGRFGPHNVVIACLPAGQTGLSSAAVVAAQMLLTFPSIRFGLMVGIGGGVPSAQHDIRLGDVVVSKPGTHSGGVVQYDFGKVVRKGRFQHTGWLNAPPLALLSAIQMLQATHAIYGNQFERHLLATATPSLQSQFVYQGADNDKLFESTYGHAGGATCEQCDKSRIVERPARKHLGPMVHYGVIASANEVMKHAPTRDLLAREYNVICFEMEAAGLMNHFPCLVIRGICDYADEHKNDQWQEYAAATAAAYAKELLISMPAEKVNLTNTALARTPATSTPSAQSEVVQIPHSYSLWSSVHSEPGYTYYQHYWHSPYPKRPSSDDIPDSKHVLPVDINRLHQKIAESSSSMENELSKFMREYENKLIEQLRGFPNVLEQNSLFQTMMQAAEGLYYTDYSTMRTLLHYVAMNGAADVLEPLVEAGFKVNDIDSDRRTPLHLAIIGNHADAVKVLIEQCDADVHIRDLNNNLPWHYSLAIDCDNSAENHQRMESKVRIMRMLAAHTDLDKVNNRSAKGILAKLKENPNAVINVDNGPVSVKLRYEG